jgi:hypothetical protein
VEGGREGGRSVAPLENGHFLGFSIDRVGKVFLTEVTEEGSQASCMSPSNESNGASLDVPVILSRIYLLAFSPSKRAKFRLAVASCFRPAQRKAPNPDHASNTAFAVTFGRHAGTDSNPCLLFRCI